MYSSYNKSSYAVGRSQYPSYYGTSTSNYQRHRSTLPDKPNVSLYSSRSTTYGSSYLKPSAQTKDIVRPRTRHPSSSRDVGSTRKIQDGEHSVPRSRTDPLYQSQSTYALQERGRDPLSRRKGTPSSYSRDLSVPRSRGISPLRRERPLPEFTTIKSNNQTRAGRSTSLDRSARTRAKSPVIRTIEVQRNIYKNDDQLRGLESYSPSFAENVGKKHKEYNDIVNAPSRSSTSSRREETSQNGYYESPSSSSCDTYGPNAGLIGLKNIGNTCFMNSILQCLSNTKSLRKYCLDEKFKMEINAKSPMKGKLMHAFSKLMSQLWHPSSSGGAVSTSDFKNQLQKFSKRFSGYEQQDCQEFLRCLIEGLHEDVNKATEKRSRAMPNFDTLCEESKAEKTWQFYLSKDNSFIVDLFMGQLKSSLECQDCGHVSVTFDPFWDLSLPLPKNLYRTSYDPSVSVMSCLESFTGEETLDRDERPTCDKCKCRRRMIKKFTIHKFPKILVIHLKRFSEGSYRHKLSFNVDFSHRLKISQPVSTSDSSFQLYAVSNHSGSCYGGHYTAYCKNPEMKRWHCFNDGIVSSMSESSVQSKEAYVLFYEQSSSRSHL